jgi:hypothetical protein
MTATVSASRNRMERFIGGASLEKISARCDAVVKEYIFLESTRVVTNCTPVHQYTTGVCAPRLNNCFTLAEARAVAEYVAETSSARPEIGVKLTTTHTVERSPLRVSATAAPKELRKQPHNDGLSEPQSWIRSQNARHGRLDGPV